MAIELPILATAALASGLLFFSRSFRDLRVRRLIQNTPTARIRSMPMGLVEVNGTVTPRSMALAPFSGTACAYWEVEIATRTRQKSWTVVHRNASGQPFFLHDGTGAALVYPRGAQFTSWGSRDEECAGVALPECYAEYLRAHGLSASLWRLGVLRFRERVLEEGQQVYVMGTAVPRSHATTLSDGDALQATGTDDPYAVRLHDLDRQVVAVVRQGDPEKTFLISQRSERALVTDLGLRAVAELVGGPLLTLAGLAYWLGVVRSGHVFP